MSFRTIVFSLVFVAGCAGAANDDDASSSDSALGPRPVDAMERFPDPARVQDAMNMYIRDPNGARMEPPIGVAEFFGGGQSSANIDKLRVERLRPDPRYGGKPIAFLSAEFHGTDMYWNNRYKDVQLSKLFDKIGVRFVFPEAEHVPTEGRALVRIWTDYTPVSKDPPADLHGDALKMEVARLVVASYVAGNVDGPAHNGSNGGFAKFKDVSGRELWRGVVIDNGASWNTPSEEHKPWKTNILNTGPVEKGSIPVDLLEGLIRIAQGSLSDLATWSKFDQVDDGAKDVVRGERARAQEILDHYGVEYVKPQAFVTIEVFQKAA